MAYKILWYSMASLHDTSNGAAICNKVLLEALVRRGFEVKVLNTMAADDPQGMKEFEQLVKTRLNPSIDSPFWQFTDNGIEYFVVQTTNRNVQAINRGEQDTMFNFYSQLLEKFQPDLVMGYGGDLYSCYLRYEAQCRGIAVAYALCNGFHHEFAFGHCDLVFAPSQALSDSYREQDGVEVKAVGQFINKAKVVAADRSNAKYITLVNPMYRKGLAVLVKLAMIWQKRHPEQKFLVVKSVGDYAQLVRHLHYADGTPFISEQDLQRNPRIVAQLLPNIDVAEHTNDMRLVYALTKVLLAPSVYEEAWGCVATEATFNHIPVLATNNCGLPEAVGEGGIVLPPPPSSQADNLCIPSDEEIAPYVAALERLLNEDWTEACARASANNDVERSVDRLLVYLQPLLEKAQKNKHPFSGSAYVTAKSLQKREQEFKAKQELDAAAAPKLETPAAPQPAE